MDGGDAVAAIEKKRALSGRSVQMELEATHLRATDRATEAVGVVERIGEGFEDMLAAARDAGSGCRRSGVGFNGAPRSLCPFDCRAHE
jgi:hypothetical protein